MPGAAFRRSREIQCSCCPHWRSQHAPFGVLFSANSLGHRLGTSGVGIRHPIGVQSGRKTAIDMLRSSKRHRSSHWAWLTGFTLATFFAHPGLVYAEEAEEAASNAETEESAQAPENPLLAQARLHFSNGVELLQENPPNYQDAFPQFLAAYEKSERSWKVLGNLGLCALKLERDGEALDYYRRYLDEGGEEIDQEERAAIERELLLVEGNLARVSLGSVMPDTQVKVSRQGSDAPPQVYRLGDDPTNLGLRAGAHTLTASAQGKSQTWEIVLTPGQQAEHRFDFAEPAPSSPVHTAPPPAATPADSGGASPLRVTGFVTAGVGVAALLGGGITGLLSKQREDSAREQCAGNVCPSGAREDFDSAESFATLTNVLLIGGGVLAATGVTLILVGGSSSDERPAAARLTLTPAPFAEGGGLWASGTF